MKKLCLIFILLFLMFPASAEELLGDLNGDGSVTSVDGLIALQMSVGKLQPTEAADVDFDGAVTSYDALQILQFAVGDKDPLFVQIYAVIHDLKVGNVLKDERMNWFIERKDGSVLKVAVVVSGGIVEDIRKGEIPDPTMKVYSDEDTVKELLKSQDPKKVKEALDSGKIRLEGVGLGNQIRVAFMNLFSRFV